MPDFASTAQTIDAQIHALVTQLRQAHPELTISVKIDIQPKKLPVYHSQHNTRPLTPAETAK